MNVCNGGSGVVRTNGKFTVFMSSSITYCHDFRIKHWKLSLFIYSGWVGLSALTTGLERAESGGDAMIS